MTDKKPYVLTEEVKKLQKLAGIEVNEYGNQGPSTPTVYLVSEEGKKIKEVPFSEVSKVKNLIYDLGGGETSYYDEYNVVVIDNFPVKEFAKRLLDNSNANKKLYISYNLEKPYSFPKANKIIISQLTFNLNNVEALAETVNNSLNSNGQIEFFSSEMSKKCKEFLKTLIKKYKFYLPDNITLDKISKYKSEILTLQKSSTFSTPNKIKIPKEHTYEIKTKYGDALVKYILDGDNYFNTKKLSGNIPDKYLQQNVNDHEYSKKTGDISVIGTRFELEKHDASKSPYPYFEDFYDEEEKLQPLKIISWKKLNN